MGIMTKRTQVFALGAWSTVGVPAVFAVFIFVAYKVALASGNLPFISMFGEVLWFGVFGILVLSGTLAIVYLPFSKWFRAVACMLYVPAMSCGLFLIGLWGACTNGDCL